MKLLPEGVSSDGNLLRKRHFATTPKEYNPSNFYSEDHSTLGFSDFNAIKQPNESNTNTLSIDWKNGGFFSLQKITYNLQHAKITAKKMLPTKLRPKCSASKSENTKYF